MTRTELETRVGHLEQRFRAARVDERLRMRPEVQKIIRRLKDQRQPLPCALSRINARLEQDEFDDMFENMPV